MTTLQLIKMPGGMLRPANQVDAEKLEKITNGRLLLAEVTQPRNPSFHRKLFALLNFGFEYWTPEAESVNGVTPEKNFERFRKDVLILAGFRTMVVNVKNEVRYEAESISFAKMDETRFAEVYQSVFNVIWRIVLSRIDGLTVEVVENTINQMLSFD